MTATENRETFPPDLEEAIQAAVAQTDAAVEAARVATWATLDLVEII